MKNFSFVSLASATIISLTLIGCSNSKSSSDSENNAPERVASKSISFDWQQPYLSTIETFKGSPEYSSENSRFDLRDLNNDGTPELIISPNFEKNTACKVYTFSDGSITELGDNGNYGSFTFYPNSGILSNEHDGDGFVIGEYRTIENGAYKEKLSFYNNSGSASDGATITYEINKKEVSMREYNDSIAAITGFAFLDIGRKYTIDSADTVLHSAESWGAVLTENEKALYSAKLAELDQQYDDYAGFELADLDGNDIPELIISDGIDQDKTCRIFYLKDDTVAELEGTFGSLGQIGFDFNNLVFFTIDSNKQCWNMTGKPLNNYEKSNCLMECGRKYLLNDTSIAAAFR